MMRPLGMALTALLTTMAARADDAPRWIGELGAGLARAQLNAPHDAAHSRVVPYAYGDLGRLFVREDTFGAKLVPAGWGALELVGRASTEGSDANARGRSHRSNPRPVGLGTFQETPWGGFFVDAFVDTNSGGTLLEASYAAELTFAGASLYPQLGVTRRSARYNAHLFDVHAVATTPVFQLSAELPITDHWVFLAHAQLEPFDSSVRASARVNARSRSMALVALAWQFK